MSLAPIYLDNNATTPVHPEVVEVIARCMRDGFANPGSRHVAGRRARVILEDARETIARILRADPAEVIFTSGGTESSNLAIFGLTSGRRGVIVLTAGEHPATLESCKTLLQRGFRGHTLPVDCHGQLRPETFSDVPWSEVALVTVILAHNETGVIQDLTALSELCQEHRVPLHVDAVQAAGKIAVDFTRLGATTLSLGAHKFQGPRGIGALLVRKGVTLTPWMFGGHQEQDRRPGTEAVPLIAGMARALEIWEAEQADRTARVTRMRNKLESALQQRCAPVVVNGAGAPRLPNTLNISFPGCDGEAVLVALDLQQVCCSLGSTCASGAAEPAPSLVAMGCSPEVYRSAVRFSVGPENTDAEIDEAVDRISRVIALARECGG
ncbi:MAG: cysteine desulfurase family protein [Planctomycetota bacterium]